MTIQWVIIAKTPLLVRGGKDLKSDALEEKLAPGSVVEELQLVKDRLFFKKVSGGGPIMGWISTSLKKGDKVNVLARRKSEIDAEDDPSLDTSSKESTGPKKILLEPGNLAQEKQVFWPVGWNGDKLSVRIAEPADGQKAAACVLFVCGMPMKLFGDARCEDEFPTAVMERCWKIGLPTVRFNYTGYGGSEGEEFDGSEGPYMLGDIGGIVQRVLADVADKILPIAFSAGNTNCLPHFVNENSDKLLAYISVSLGVRSNALNSPEGHTYKSITGMSPKDFFKEFYPSMVDDGKIIPDVPQLWIKGEDDWMTPLNDVEYFANLSKKEMTVYYTPLDKTIVVHPGKHAFENGNEDAPADAIKLFILKHFYK